jgi:anti-sigma factor RsiW
MITHPRHELLALVEHRLDSARRATVEAHLAVCSRCRVEAAELLLLTDNLAAIPAAMRPLVEGAPGGRGREWPVIWSRIERGPMRRIMPQLSFYLSVAVTVFVFALTVPTGIGAPQLAATVGAIQTPLAAQATPGTLGPDARLSNLGAAAASTALVRAYTAARPIPVPTPVPGPKG